MERGLPGFEVDATRPLTDEGREKVRQVARGMARLGLAFDRVLSSPYLRARETAEIVVETLASGGRLEFSDRLAEDDAHEALIREIARWRPAPESLLLVGHEPNLSELTALLLTGQTAVPIHFKKAGLACLSVTGIEPGPCAVLEWLLTPKQLRMFA